MSRNTIGTFVRAEEYERGEAGPSWLDRFAKELEAKEGKTAVEIARERDREANIVTQISSIIGGDKPRYRSVDEAVAYYQNATGLTEYKIKAAADTILEKTAGVLEFSEEQLSGGAPEIEVSEESFEDESEPAAYEPPEEIDISDLLGESGPAESSAEYPNVPSSEEIKKALMPGAIKSLLSALNSTIFRLEDKAKRKAQGKPVSFGLKPEAKDTLSQYGLYSEGWVDRDDYLQYLKDVKDSVGAAWTAALTEIKQRRSKKADEQDLKKKV